MKRLRILLSLLVLTLPCAVMAQTEEPQEPMTIVETMPEWGTCPESAGEGFMHPSRECTEQAIVDFVVSELKYPKKARRKGIEGKVVVKFVIEKNGEVGEPASSHPSARCSTKRLCAWLGPCRPSGLEPSAASPSA